MRLCGPLQDVIGRGSKRHPLYARVVEARSPMAIVMPANSAAGLQVLFQDKPGTSEILMDITLSQTFSAVS